MEQFADNFPLNAGVNVAFPSRKVTFTYSEKPTSKKSFSLVWASMFMLWLFIHVLLIIVLILGFLIAGFLRFLVALQTSGFVVPVFEAVVFDFWGGLFALLIALSPLIYLCTIPAIPAFILTWKYDKFSKIFPKLNYFMVSLFEPKKRVVVKSLNEPVFVLPLFQNVYLGYEATKDFSLFLKNIEVKEFGFKYLRKDAIGKEREVPISTRWNATFSFTEIPKCGELVINFL